MAAKSSISEIDAQIEKLRERKRMLIVKSADRFARAATRAGLAEMEIADEEIERIFTEMAARFRKGEREEAANTGSAARRPTTDEAGTSPETAHDG